jgi:hypothetical protein
MRDLLDEHLTAAMIMVRLEDPLPADMSARHAAQYLEKHGYDCALLDSTDLRIVYRSDLKAIDEDELGRAVADFSSGPIADRLIERSLKLGDAARRIIRDERPLIVVGPEGPEFIVTRSDFTRPAGQAGVLGVLGTLDTRLDELLQLFADEVWDWLDEDNRKKIEGRRRLAVKRNEEVSPLSYLTLGQRLKASRELSLGRRLGIELGSAEEHKVINDARVDLAHGKQELGGKELLESLALAERLLDALDFALPAARERPAGQTSH